MFDINNKIIDMSNRAIDMCREQFVNTEKISEINQQKVLKAFIDSKVSESHFTASTGYGYNDRGRDMLDKVYAAVFETEDALVRHGFVNGTHAISTALFGVLRPGDSMLCVTGIPYDTMHSVIGIENNCGGSLKDFGIGFEYINLNTDGTPDYDKIIKKVKEKNFKVIYIQRSRGYSLRNSLSSTDIGKISDIVKNINSDIIVIVDNCYGEFVEIQEPTKVGADLVAGSLIKNPGGGIAPSGGYIAGKKKLIELCSYRFTVPGEGKEVGATLNQNRELFMGIFNAPHVTVEALKTAIFTAALFQLMDYEVYPKYSDKRRDIIQSVKLGSPEKLIAFCRGIQRGSPIDSFVTPEPWDMPGYNHKIIMAAGTFTSGSSIELSADAPLREPYAVYLQGGLNFYSAKTGVIMAANEVINI